MSTHFDMATITILYLNRIYLYYVTVQKALEIVSENLVQKIKKFS